MPLPIKSLICVLRPIAAIAITIKNFPMLPKKEDRAIGIGKNVLIRAAKIKPNIKSENTFLFLKNLLLYYSYIWTEKVLWE